MESKLSDLIESEDAIRRIKYLRQTHATMQEAKRFVRKEIAKEYINKASSVDELKEVLVLIINGDLK